MRIIPNSISGVFSQKNISQLIVGADGTWELVPPKKTAPGLYLRKSKDVLIHHGLRVNPSKHIALLGE